MVDDISKVRDIESVAADLGLNKSSLEPWGRDKAKIDCSALSLEHPAGHTILVTAMSPTPLGEGKTTTAIGLAMALCRLGKRAVVGLREPSMGPVFGMKGGATGGGLAQLHPREDINLHFTGDMHAITTAHNLLSALINNSMAHGNPFLIDSRKIPWPRVMDMNDRSLRRVVLGLGGRDGGMIDEDRFDITAASEIMAIVCLSKNISDLRERLNRIVVAFSNDGHPIYASDLMGTGAMAALLKDAFKPNLVQTSEGTPAIIHGGPFANIAHGTSSLIASRLGRSCADYFVTEAGFGSDLGAEKYFDIFCRESDTKVSAVTIVATVRALKYHGGVLKGDIAQENLGALKLGYSNLKRHVEIVRAFGFEPVVALNVTPFDTAAELTLALSLCALDGICCVKSEVFARGGQGGEALAQEILSKISERTPKFAYDLNCTLKEKIEAVAKGVYRAGSVVYTAEAARELTTWEELGYGKLPICIAKTQYSFSDDPKNRGAPEGFEFQIREVRLSAGAGFVVPISGEIMTMPGLPKSPNAERIILDDDGTILGV